MGPVLEYGCTDWDPQGVVLQEELENVHKCAVRFETGNYNYETWRMTGILEHLTLKATITTAADDKFCSIFSNFRKNKACYFMRIVC